MQIFLTTNSRMRIHNFAKSKTLRLGQSTYVKELQFLESLCYLFDVFLKYKIRQHVVDLIIFEGRRVMCDKRSRIGMVRLCPDIFRAMRPILNANVVGDCLHFELLTIK